LADYDRRLKQLESRTAPSADDPDKEMREFLRKHTTDLLARSAEFLTSDERRELDEMLARGGPPSANDPEFKAQFDALAAAAMLAQAKR